MVKSINTKSIIKEVAAEEFLNKGFKDASLRNIANKAGVTTGAIYGYYKDKEAIFGDIVGGVANEMLGQYSKFEEEFFENIEGNATFEYIDDHIDYLTFFINYIYDNYKNVKLLLCCSKGTKYENIIENLVVREVSSTKKFLKCYGIKNTNISDEAFHILITAYFNGIFEVILHDMSKETALAQVNSISNFFRAGWKSIIENK